MSSATSTDARIGFEQAFGLSPKLEVRAPGRVNLIGEHTDYSHLPVLPIAIGRRIEMAVGRSAGTQVEVVSSAFAVPARLELEQEDVAIDAMEPWHRYLLGALRSIPVQQRAGGVRIFVAGDLPAVGGLSSSSALTVGLIASLEAAWKIPLARASVVERAIRAERIVGVESGGMDQNVIVYARQGHALRIDFDPTRTTQVALPEDAAWIAASSGIEAPKAGRVREHYNARVLGTRLASALLGQQLGRSTERLRLSGFADPEGLEAMRLLPETSSAQEVARATGARLADLVRSSRDGLPRATPVPVRVVARHVLEEAARVDAAQKALARGALEEVGELLNASHRSLQDFGASTPELDSVCEAMRAEGALGARLTGAGFGGFALALCLPDRARAVQEAAVLATGGPAFPVQASDGLSVVPIPSLAVRSRRS